MQSKHATVRLAALGDPEDAEVPGTGWSQLMEPGQRGGITHAEPSGASEKWGIQELPTGRQIERKFDARWHEPNEVQPVGRRVLRRTRVLGRFVRLAAAELRHALPSWTCIWLSSPYAYERQRQPTDSQQEPERLNTLNTVTVSTRRVNKVAFVLLCFFLGGFGVDRFMRGQVGLGIFKFLIGSWATLGIWPLVDFIIALVKLGKYQDEFVFDNAGKWVEPAAH